MTSHRDRDTGRAAAIDGSHEKLRSEDQVQLAIYAAVDAAFGAEAQSTIDRDAIHASLPPEPTVIQVIDAVFARYRKDRAIDDEKRRRGRAGMALALLLLDATTPRPAQRKKPGASA